MGGVDEAEIPPRLTLQMKVDGNGILLSSDEMSPVNESTWNEQRSILVLECTLVLLQASIVHSGPESTQGGQAHQV